ncbi:FG-GAP repeat-containing protein [Halogeometricum rufum]|uniref:FG-GAP repeat-containing protein n=1 Tax=Halogeometricum rufum TaxID=553469 RepID=A0A1I6I716_9EURY|nr:FG-GAP repeat-containing protein [Halogeometricum rufum]
MSRQTNSSERRRGRWAFGRRPFLRGVVGATTVGVLGSGAAAAQQEPELKLVGDPNGNGDGFGRSVAVLGGTLFVGANGDDDLGPNAGAVYVFEREGGGWSRAQKLVAGDGNFDDGFGFSVSVSGDTLFVGAPFVDTGGFNRGAAYVFERDTDTGTWSQVQKLQPPDTNTNDFVGVAVSVADDTALVTTRNEEDNGFDAGSAYVYERDDGQWEQIAKLFPDDPASNDWFGFSGALSGATAAVGAPQKQNRTGAAYVFERRVGWGQTAKLTPDDALDPGDEFGRAVAIDGNRVAVGAYRDDDEATDAGAVYLFERAGNDWEQAAKLYADDAADGDEFGFSVAVAGNEVLVGAWRADDGGTDSGAVYRFRRRGQGWRQVAKYTASDAAAGDYLGNSVTLQGDTVVAGAYGDDNDNGNAGAAYVFDR